MYDEPIILNSGDIAVTLEIGNSIDKETFIKVRQISITIEKEKISWIKEYMPTFRSILIHYDPSKIKYKDLLVELMRIVDRSKEIKKIIVKKYLVPAIFGGQFGPDLERVAKIHDISEKDVINIFIGKEYLNYFNGFAPGLPNLPLPESLFTPRLKVPRIKIPYGSIGLGGQQACIYPLDSPGGHNLIGRTPIILFNKEKLLLSDNLSESILFKTGDYLKFYSIDEEEYYIIKDNIANNKFKITFDIFEERLI